MATKQTTRPPIKVAPVGTVRATEAKTISPSGFVSTQKAGLAQTTQSGKPLTVQQQAGRAALEQNYQQGMATQGLKANVPAVYAGGQTGGQPEIQPSGAPSVDLKKEQELKKAGYYKNATTGLWFTATGSQIDPTTKKVIKSFKEIGYF